MPSLVYSQSNAWSCEGFHFNSVEETHLYLGLKCFYCLKAPLLTKVTINIVCQIVRILLQLSGTFSEVINVCLVIQIHEQVLESHRII